MPYLWEDSISAYLLCFPQVFPPDKQQHQQQAAAGTAPGSISAPTLSQQTQVVRDTVIPALLEAGHDDDDRLAVAAAGSALVSILRALGAAGFSAKDLEGVAQIATNILKGEAFCQVSREGLVTSSAWQWEAFMSCSSEKHSRKGSGQCSGCSSASYGLLWSLSKNIEERGLKRTPQGKVAHILEMCIDGAFWMWLTCVCVLLPGRRFR